MLVNDTISFNVKKLPPISVTWNVSDTKMCLGDSVNVDFTIKGGDSTKYNWVLNGASTNSKINKIALANTQNVTLDLKDGCSPDVNFIQKVVISPSKLNLAILSADSTNCPGTKAAFIEVSNTAVKTPVSYKWNDPLLQTTAKILGLRAGNYKVIASDTFGCEDSLSVKVVDYGVVFQAFTDTTIYRGTAIKLRLKNAVASKWLGPSILGKDSGLIITVKPLKDTIYTVVGLDKNGCLGKDTVTVLVIDPLTVRIPNIITPNGDRRNDVWDLIELAELDQYTIIIIDRLGKRVYKSENYGNDWGGKDMDGNELPVGAYFFKMTHRKSFNVIQGYIQIIR
jgi:gliding motility-associated-like protein